MKLNRRWGRAYRFALLLILVLSSVLTAQSPLTSHWRAHVPGPLEHSCPAVGADGVIYVGADAIGFGGPSSNPAELVAFDPEGRQRWRCPTSDGFASPLTIGDDGTIYITSIEPGGLESGRDHLFAFHPDGTRWWHFGAPRAFGDSPVIRADGSVYVGSADTNLYCLNRDGRLKWTFKAGGAIEDAAALTIDGDILFGASDGLVYAVKNDGTLLGKSQDTNGTSIALTLGVGGTVYTYTYYGRRIAIAADGAKRWETNLNSQASGPVVVGADGTVYLSAHDGLHAFTPDGNPRWTAEPTLYSRTAPAISADGTLYLLDGLRSLGAYLPDGSLLWQKAFTGELHDAPVVAADGTLRLATYDHQLFSLNPDGTERWSALLSGVASNGLALDSAGGALVATTDGPIQAIHADGHPRWSLLSALWSLTTAAIGSDGTIYESLVVTNSATGTGMYVLEALRPDGTELWTTPLEGAVFPPAIALAADGLVYVGSGTNLAAVDSGGQVRWMYDTRGPLPLAGPVLGLDGRLYIIGDKVLHVLQTGSGPAANAWAMQRAHPRGTASLNRPVPPPLQAGLEDGRLRLTVPAPAPPAMTLLSTRDLHGWQILTNPFQGTNSVLLDLPSDPGANEYYRIAFP